MPAPSGLHRIWPGPTSAQHPETPCGTCRRCRAIRLVLGLFGRNAPAHPEATAGGLLGARWGPGVWGSVIGTASGARPGVLFSETLAPSIWYRATTTRRKPGAAGRARP